MTCVNDVRSDVWPSPSLLPGAVPASPALSAVMRVVLRALTVPQPPHHLVVLVSQDSRQEKRRLVRAAGLEASPRPALAVNGNVPLTLGAGSPLAASGAAASRRQRLLGGVVAGRVGVVAQLVDPLHKLALFVENFLGGEEKEESGEPRLSRVMTRERRRRRRCHAPNQPSIRG